MPKSSKSKATTAGSSGTSREFKTAKSMISNMLSYANRQATEGIIYTRASYKAALKPLNSAVQRVDKLESLTDEREFQNELTRIYTDLHNAYNAVQQYENMGGFYKRTRDVQNYVTNLSRGK